MEWIHNLHSAQGIASLIQAGGILAIIGIVFAETGLLLGFFLPGDSLIITAGLLANQANPHHIEALNIGTLNLLLGIAAIVGDQTGFFLGRKTGDAVWERSDGRFYKKKHLISAHEFYEKWGGISVVGARFVPILRTFVPFAAGVARMPYRNFILWNIAGGLLWITSMLWIGFYLGQTSLANSLDKIIVIVVVVSLLPLCIGILKKTFFQTISKDDQSRYTSSGAK